MKYNKKKRNQYFIYYKKFFDCKNKLVGKLIVVIKQRYSLNFWFQYFEVIKKYYIM